MRPTCLLYAALAAACISVVSGETHDLLNNTAAILPELQASSSESTVGSNVIRKDVPVHVPATDFLAMTTSGADAMGHQTFGREHNPQNALRQLRNITVGIRRSQRLLRETATAVQTLTVRYQSLRKLDERRFASNATHSYVKVIADHLETLRHFIEQRASQAVVAVLKASLTLELSIERNMERLQTSQRMLYQSERIVEDFRHWQTLIQGLKDDGVGIHRGLLHIMEDQADMKSRLQELDHRCWSEIATVEWFDILAEKRRSGYCGFCDRVLLIPTNSPLFYPDLWLPAYILVSAGLLSACGIYLSWQAYFQYSMQRQRLFIWTLSFVFFWGLLLRDFHVGRSISHRPVWLKWPRLACVARPD